MARTPKTPGEQRAQFSIGLPPEYEARKAPLLERFGPIATQQYGADKGFSGVVRLALDNLEKQPPAADTRAPYLPVDAYEPIALADVARIITSTETLALILPDPSVWLKIHRHDDALILRATERMSTTIFLPCSTHEDGRHFFHDEVYHLLSECFHIHERNHLSAEDVSRFFRIIGIPETDMVLHTFTLLTEAVAFLEIHSPFDAIKLGYVYPKTGRGSAVYAHLHASLLENDAVIVPDQIDGVSHFYQSDWYSRYRAK